MTQMLDPRTINDVDRPAFLVSLCGARYNGRQRNLPGRPDLIVFTDPVTHSTLALPEPEVTIGTVWRALQDKRREYRESMA